MSECFTNILVGFFLSFHAALFTEVCWRVWRGWSQGGWKSGLISCNGDEKPRTELRGFAPVSSGRLENEEVQVVEETLAKLNWSVLNTFARFVDGKQVFVDGKQVLISSSSLSVSRVQRQNVVVFDPRLIYRQQQERPTSLFWKNKKNWGLLTSMKGLKSRGMKVWTDFL